MNAINFDALYSCRNVLALDAMTALYCRLSIDDANTATATVSRTNALYPGSGFGGIDT